MLNDPKARLIHLRVKIKTLATEAGIIRHEARKTSGYTKYDLNRHRTTIVREYARLNLLAYGLLRGVPYQKIETKCDISPDLKKVAELAKRFGGEDPAIEAWVLEAKAHLKAQKKC